ncbi:putative transposase [Blastopirellula marina DSM 3645]|uniref:Putative transposase n=1 Tax=Blastopirellula marina DSM 3645 TaxID=314230 RepID=A4A242_9BACT|nr:putative transposase [Blastopirellula marina DSM 3645]
MLVICVLAVIAGADGPRSIAIWVEAHADWLKKRLELPGGIPSHDMIGRLLALLKPSAFQQCFDEWLTAMRQEATNESDAREIIAIDGKTLRRSHDRGKGLGPLCLVSAWAVRAGVSLGQVAAADKSNEIVVFPELIAQIDVSKAIVTLDAAGCQRDVAEKIIAGKGDYVLALKGNQERLHEQVRDYITTQLENDFDRVKVERHEEEAKGHGRLDKLFYYQLKLPDEVPAGEDWCGLKTIGVAIRISQENGRETFDTRYYISSLKPDAKQFAGAVRGHWGIDNSLHWTLDVTFREDESRLRNRIAAENLAWLKRLAVSLIKQRKSKESVVMRRRMTGWNVNFLAEILGLGRS